jgi:hypothetical protein
MKKFDDDSKKFLKKPKHTPNVGGMRIVNPSWEDDDPGESESIDYGSWQRDQPVDDFLYEEYVNR